MSEIMIENGQLKLKILEYERRYLEKKGILEPSVDDRIKMDRAVSSRLKKEIKSIGEKHLQITKTIYELTPHWY